MNSAETTPKKFELPKGLLDYDYEEGEDRIPSAEETADKVVPKINAFLEQFNLEDKKAAMKMIDDELMSSGSFSEDTYSLALEVYKKLFLSRLH